MRTFIRAILATICLLQVVRSEALTINLTQYAQQGGGLTYDLRIAAGNFITFPDGSTNYAYAYTVFERQISYQQLSERYFGKWTVEKQTVAGPGPETKVFTFDFLPFSEIPVPALVGLSDYDLVGTTLPISWAFPSGESMPDSRLSLTPAIYTKVAFPEPNHAALQLDLAGRSSQAVELQVAGGGNINRYLGPITVPPGTYTREKLEGTYLTWSPPVTLMVVPEPSTYALAAIGIATLLVARRRSFAASA
jgi:hypothetical protein